MTTGNRREKGKQSTLRWVGVPRSRPASPTPIQVPFPSASHASTAKTAKNHLTQLAMEHRPKTLPISKTSQEKQIPTKWRQLLSPFLGLFTIYQPLPEQSLPPPHFASLPPRPGGNMEWERRRDENARTQPRKPGRLVSELDVLNTRS